jgi:hypothetical protein
MSTALLVYNSPRTINIDGTNVASSASGMGVARINGDGVYVDFKVFDLAGGGATKGNELATYIQNTPSDYVFVLSTEGNVSGSAWTVNLVNAMGLFNANPSLILAMQSTSGFQYSLIADRSGNLHGESATAKIGTPLVYTIGDDGNKRTENYLSRDGRDPDELRTVTGDIILGTNPGPKDPYESTGPVAPVTNPVNGRTYDEAPDRKYSKSDTADNNHRIRNIAPAEVGSDAVNLQQLIDHIVNDSDTSTSTGGSETPTPSIPPSSDKTWSQRRIYELLVKMIDHVMEYVD